MTPTFPSFLKEVRLPYRPRPEPQVARTEMESGPAKQARVRSRAMVYRELQYVVGSNADYQAWRTWFNEDISGGALWFEWRDSADDQVKLARIVGGVVEEESDAQLETWIIKFTLETWG